MFDARENPDDLPAKEYDPGREHPTPEQLFIREAEKHLTRRQRQIWEYWNYDRLTQDEIAIKLGIRQQTVCEHIRAAEERINKWCNESMHIYNVIKEQMEKE